MRMRTISDSSGFYDTNDHIRLSASEECDAAGCRFIRISCRIMAINLNVSVRRLVSRRVFLQSDSFSGPNDGAGGLDTTSCMVTVHGPGTDAFLQRINLSHEPRKRLQQGIRPQKWVCPPVLPVNGFVSLQQVLLHREVCAPFCPVLSPDRTLAVFQPVR